MKQIDFGIDNYERKDELKTFVTSINNLFVKYCDGCKDADKGLKKIDKEIDIKNKNIINLNVEIDNLGKKEKELVELKNFTLDSIKEYENNKKNIDFEDNEVKKMEIDDIDTLINSKKKKIEVIDAKLESTRNKVKETKEVKKTTEEELCDLKENRRISENSLFRTENILNLVKKIQTDLNDSICDILQNKIVPNENVTENNSYEKNEKSDKKNYNEKEKTKEIEESNLNFKFDDIIPAPKKIKENIVFEKEKEQVNYNELLEDLFNKEVINFNDFSINVREKMVNNAENVIKNLSILKKHKIPLELTLSQNSIYYDISPQDLEDLLNIVTSDDEGNGMGFDISFTYYILNELAKTNVDTLIDVYNNEFMNIGPKSGIISLLKKAGLSKEKFNSNRQANVDTLELLGLKNLKEIKEKYPEFVDMDNPLFIEALNLFDKDDLIAKISDDIDIIPKIIEYWKNN